jgi:hypothetical protein
VPMLRMCDEPYYLLTAINIRDITFSQALGRHLVAFLACGSVDVHFFLA